MITLWSMLAAIFILNILNFISFDTLVICETILLSAISIIDVIKRKR